MNHELTIDRCGLQAVSRSVGQFRWLLACCGLLGCGGRDTPSAPPPIVQPPPAIAPAPAAPAPAAVPQVKGPAATGPAIADQGEPTSRDWEQAELVGNYEVAPLDESRRRLESLAVAPPAGLSSREVEAFLPKVELPPSAALRSLPPGFLALPGEVSPAGWPWRIRCIADGMELQLVPEVLARVGANSGPPDTQPEHAAFQTAFYIDRHEVTLEQYRAYREKLRQEKKPLPPAPINDASPPQHPVLGVSWRDAEAYARAMGRALPTEAEWEAAGRGPAGFQFPWGNGRALWDGTRLPGQIDPVGSHPGDVSRYGVADLAGNAREWVADWYRADAFREAVERDGSPRKNWSGPQRSEPVGHRVIKGSVTGWELWARGHALQTQALSDVGFRCVLRLPESP